MMVVRKLVEAAVKLSKYDKRAWDKLYFGIRKDIKLGIKHGFGAGSALGTFINDESNPFLEDAPTLFTPKSKTNKFKKGNNRQYSSGRYGRHNKYCSCRKCRR